MLFTHAGTAGPPAVRWPILRDAGRRGSKLCLPVPVQSMDQLDKCMAGRSLTCAHLHSFLHGAGARVVAKRSPSEKVGVFARRGDAVEVVEYSELGQAEAEAVLEGQSGSISHTGLRHAV